MGIPKIIRDGQYDYYGVEDFLGKGTFSKCYTLKDIKSGKLVAGKCICKKTIRTYKLKAKIEDEIRIHRSLNHKNIVRFVKFFEDTQFVYIILELCTNRSLADLIRKRHILVPSEAKYFMRQTSYAVQYLHSNSIVHRDLKLGNLFIDSRMRIKVGDFGLSAYIKGNDKRYTLCGTPNYIAPEVISNAGHSFEVDIWALGCILYNFLVGFPPFHSKSTETTYEKILKCDYKIPDNILPSASTFIRQTLQLDSSERPDINELLNFDFLISGHIPDSLDATQFHCTPSSITDVSTMDLEIKKVKRSMDAEITKLQTQCIDNSRRHLRRLMRYLKRVEDCPVLNEDSAELDEKHSQPLVWINAWVDYSVMYGFAYRLNDNRVGVLFNDHSCMMQSSDSECIYYLSTNGVYYSISKKNPSAKFLKKLQILARFQQYMQASLRNAYDNQSSGSEAVGNVPILVYWLRFEDSIAMLLSNGIFQINFIDHCKLILCPVTKTVKYIQNEDAYTSKVNTYKFDTLKIHGCSRTLSSKLNVTLQKVNQVYNTILEHNLKTPK